MSNTPPDQPAPPTKTWRYHAGISILVLAGVLPLGALLVPLLGLSTSQTTLVVGLMVGGAPEVLCLVAVALMGKENVSQIVGSVKQFLYRIIFATPASKHRYYAGLTVSIITLLPIYLYGYAPSLLPGDPFKVYILAGSDILFILSILFMGGEFWRKFSRIFVWEGKV
jgi:hypothetical protein